jgi:ABC-type uncharacterized transport system ATPase subunit
VVRDLLANLPVGDLTIEDPPVEEVMRELFLEQQRERKASAAGEAPS